jgi:hypothetical protein
MMVVMAVVVSVSGQVGVHMFGARDEERRSYAKVSSGGASSAPKSATTSAKRINAPSHFSLEASLPVL